MKKVNPVGVGDQSYQYLRCLSIYSMGSLFHYTNLKVTKYFQVFKNRTSPGNMGNDKIYANKRNYSSPLAKQKNLI